MEPLPYEGQGLPTVPGKPARPAENAPATPGSVQPGAAADNNVTITVEKIGTDQRSAIEASLAFRYADEDVVVSSPGGGAARRNGLRIAVAGQNFQAQLAAAASRSRSTSREKAFITCLSGSEGAILVGEDTFVERLAIWTPDGYTVVAERALLGRSLVVRPRILPDRMLEVELHPRFTVKGRAGVIDLTQLSTKVVVRDGQSIVIGGSSTEGQDLGMALFGVSSQSYCGAMTMVLTPKIGSMGIDWLK